MLSTWVRRSDGARTFARVLARVLAPARASSGPWRAVTPPPAAPAAAVARRPSIARGFAARSADSRRHGETPSQRLHNDINDASSESAVMRLVNGSWDSLEPKHLSAALSRLSFAANQHGNRGSGAREFGDADFAPIVRRIAELAENASRSGSNRPGTPSYLPGAEGFATTSALALVKLGKRRAMFDPTHDPTAKRAWNALLALCTVHGTRAYKPENIGRLKYAMTMAVDLAGAKADQTTREVAAPQATWRALDAMAGTNAAAGAHFNARGVGLGVWAHARTRTPIEPESMRAYEIAVARGALDHRGTVGQNVSNALWGYAKLGAAPSRDVVTPGFPSPWAKFEEAVVRLLPTMKPQEVANTMYAYALMGEAPSDKTWSALETEAVARASGRDESGHINFENKLGFRRRRERAGLFGPQEITNVWWAHATLKRRPSQAALRAYDKTTEQVAYHMGAQDVSNTLYSVALLKAPPMPGAFGALEAAIARNARWIDRQNLSLILWAFADLSVRPGKEAAAALSDAVERGVHTLSAQDVNMCIWGFAICGVTPSPGAWVALTDAVGARMDELKTHEVMNVAWAMAAMHVTGEKSPLMPAYAKAWKRLCATPLSEFQASKSRAIRRDGAIDSALATDDKIVGIVHHVRLIHERLFPPESAASVDLGAVMPRELETASIDEWNRQVKKPVKSKMQLNIAEVMSQAGIEFQAEKMSADGYFSMDFYLPEYDVALEYDGPSHYYKAWRTEDRVFPDTNPGFPPDEDAAVMPVPVWMVGREKTVKTAIRDMLLEAGHVRKVVNVHAHEAMRYAKKRPALRRFIENLLRREVGRPLSEGVREWWYDADASAGADGDDGEEVDAGADATEVEESTMDVEGAGLEEDGGAEAAVLTGRWIQALPAKARERLERRLDGAAGGAERWALVIASAEGDATKARADLRREVLEAR